MAVDPRMLRSGIYRIRNPEPDEHDVMVNGVSGSSGHPMRESLYRERGYSPPFEELPWADEFFS